jgi:hypothetical protein
MRAVCFGVVFVCLGMAFSGCAHVPAYERERLIHPTMRLEDMATPGEAHLHAVHEGALGGSVGSSSKCGCN